MNHDQESLKNLASLGALSYSLRGIRALGSKNELTERLVDLLNSISEQLDVTEKHGNAIPPGHEKNGVY